MSGRRCLETVVAVVVVVTFVLVGAMPVSAAETAPVGTYRERVAEARTLVEEALVGDAPGEVESFTLASELNQLLPATERVDVAGTIVVVDNSVFRGMAARLASAPRASVRAEVLEEMSAHLASLERATGEPGASVPQDADALARLLADRTSAGRSSMSRLFGDMVDRLGKMVTTWWESVGASPATGRILTVVTLVALVALTLLLLVVVVRAVVRARRETARAERGIAGASLAGAPVVPAAQGLPDDPLAFARERAAAGDRRGAVRALFGGAARSLQEAGVVRQTHVHTNGELLAQVRDGADARILGALVSLCARFERSWYGHRDPGDDGFSAARDEYVRIADAIAALDRGSDAA